MKPACEFCAALRVYGYKGCPTHAREQPPPGKPAECLCALLAASHPGLAGAVVKRCCPACRVNSPPAGLETLRPGNSQPEGEIGPQNRVKRKWAVFGGFPVPAIVRWMGADGYSLGEYRVAEDAMGWPMLDKTLVKKWLAEGLMFPDEVPDLADEFTDELYATTGG